MKTQDTTKDGLLARIKATAAKLGEADYWSQDVHKVAVLEFVFDALETPNKDRAEVAKQFAACTSGFGCNASQFNQKCGKPQKPTTGDALDARIAKMYGGEAEKPAKK